MTWRTTQRFNTKAEVEEWANLAAASDLQRHREKGHGLNPYCTDGARNDWQRGFDNKPPRSWELPTINDFCTKYQRGRAMARLLETKQ